MAMKPLPLKQIASSLLASVFLATAVFMGYGIYKADREYKNLQRSQEQKTEANSTTGTASATQNNIHFDTSFYQNSINAYAKVNGIRDLNQSVAIGDYQGTMKIIVSFPMMEKSRLISMVGAFSNLGYISNLSKTNLTIEVIPFSKGDALAQLQGAKK